MKKTIITMLIALVAMVASAETYNYLKFTKTNGSTVTYSVEGLKLTYDDSNVYVTNAETTATIALAEVQDMYFSNEAGGSEVLRGDVDGNQSVEMDDLSALINYLLTGDDTGINFEGANCDLQGDITMDDLAALINYLLTGTW